VTVKPGANVAVFLDRDGTLIEDIPYLSDPGLARLLPGAGEAVARLNEHGIKVILITNQSGVARGYFTPGEVRSMHQQVRSLLSVEGAVLDAVYYCPHLPVEELGDGERPCDCRKPGIGLILQACEEHNIDPGKSFFVGDRVTDVETGRRMGGIGILVKTGYGTRAMGELGTMARACHSCEDLPAAVDLVLSLIDR